LTRTRRPPLAISRVSHFTLPATALPLSSLIHWC